MLKPEEIKSVTFEQSVFSGYKKEDVDAFLDKLYADYTRLFQENGELVGKLKVCISKIEEYREDEKFLKSAIVNAQKLNENALIEIDAKRKETEENARQQAEEIIAQAKQQAEQMIADTESGIAELREKTTREFADKQQESRRAFEAEKAEQERLIAEKQAELAALVREVEGYRLRAIQVLERQADLLRELPETDMVAAPTIEEPVVETDLPVEEPAESVVTPDAPKEVIAFEEPVIEETPAFVPVVDESVAETVEEPAPEVEETPATLEFPEVDFSRVEIPDVDVPKVEIPEIDVPQADADEIDHLPDVDVDQISIDDVLSTGSSPVEPVETDFPEPIDEQEDPFQLFGASTLIFPEDIPEAEEEDESAGKTPRFRKKLKFGVDFDVKKDK